MYHRIMIMNPGNRIFPFIMGQLVGNNYLGSESD